MIRKTLVAAVLATMFHAAGDARGALANLLCDPTGCTTDFAILTYGVADGTITPPKIAFYDRVAIVAAAGGDYADPATAMTAYETWCAIPPSASNPCLLKIMPGSYTVTSAVVMQPYIDIEGSGEKVTLITGSLGNSGPSPATAIIRGADNAELRLLTVRNTPGGGNWVVAILNSSASPAITHVTAETTGGGDSIAIYNTSSSPVMTHVTASAAASATVTTRGVYNTGYSSPTMTDVSASATGGADSYGVYNYNNSSPKMTNVRASASGASFDSYAVRNNLSCSPVMTNVTATASAGQLTYGVDNGGSSSPTMTNVSASASGGTNMNIGISNASSSCVMSQVTAVGAGGTESYGMYNSGAGLFTVTADRSTFEGGTNSIFNSAGWTVRVGASKLVGPANAAGIYNCVNSYSDSYVALNDTCQ